MKHFIQHIIRENLAQIASESYFNYGVYGMHMINIIDTPTKGLKLYVTDSNNALQNSLPNYFSNGLTYPFQYYKKNVMIECIKGYTSVWNVFENNGNIAVLANEFEKINDDYELKRQHVGLSTEQVFSMQSGQIVNLPGNKLYNFGSRFGSQSAWLVYEGKEIDGIPDLYYTNLDNIKTDGLYQKMNARDVVGIIDALGFLK